MFSISDAGLLMKGGGKKPLDIINADDSVWIDFFWKNSSAQYGPRNYSIPLVNLRNAKHYVFFSVKNLSYVSVVVRNTDNASYYTDVNVGDGQVNVTGSGAGGALPSTNYSYTYTSAILCVEFYSSGGYKVRLWNEDTIAVDNMDAAGNYGYSTLLQCPQSLEAVMIASRKTTTSVDYDEQAYYLSLFKKLIKEVE